MLLLAKYVYYLIIFTDIPEMSALGNGQLVFMMRFETNEIPKRPEAELQKSSIELEQVIQNWKKGRKCFI